jgi:hypothetical protein
MDVTITIRDAEGHAISVKPEDITSDQEAFAAAQDVKNLVGPLGVEVVLRTRQPGVAALGTPTIETVQTVYTADELDAITELAALAASVGAGFHPDTAGDDYIELPDGVTSEGYDATVDLARSLGINVHGVGLAVLGVT